MAGKSEKAELDESMLGAVRELTTAVTDYIKVINERFDKLEQLLDLKKKAGNF